MNDNFRSAQRASNLSPLGKWLVFGLGRKIDESTSGGRTYRVVEWNGQRYMSVEDAAETGGRDPAAHVVRQRRLPAGMRVVAQR
ncbi:hypothetical protein HKCCE2091_07930 [Rhodobacterales bacterium HKCCE2091]|nr:hypothetical protein [Rhodobacterales bacterium HKCCE2091]